MAAGEHSSSARRAIFLDRDGTLNVEVNYLHRIEDLVLVPVADSAAHGAARAGR